ncbi:hypothetical protein BX600DRAFT_464071 [Xylariales sp. PMI_506]|nr:hypothetical protein BX600DRAFT_464071 [Xylariales sp. PMI_506]
MSARRSKTFLKQAKPKQKKEQKLETADDYLAAGVDFEEAAGKWRAGDAVKSMRFFQRAIEVYEQGLQAFPTNLDLAYNKARVLLEVATHPVLVQQLKQSTVVALQLALDAHRHALQLDPDNADALFNTAQVLTSIAEEIANDDDIPDTEALKLLQEALELQTKCLSIQELKFEESVEQERLAHEQEHAAESSAAEPSEAEQPAEEGSGNDAEDDDEQWFTVVEPVTHDTLIDTIVAQLNTLTTFCGVLGNSPESAPPATLAMIEEHSSKLVQKIPLVAQDKPERQQEISLAKANFVSALLEAGFKSGKIDAATYKRERDAAFTVPELLANGTVESLIANARSLISFNSALMELQQPEDSTVRWNSLTESITHLTSASKIPRIDQDDLATTHLLRGDANLLLVGLGHPPTNHQAAVTNAAQLLKNAEVFYRNASKLSQDVEQKSIAALKSKAAEGLQQQVSGGKPFDIGELLAAMPNGPQWTIEQLEDMVSEGLLPQSLTL